MKYLAKVSMMIGGASIGNALYAIEHGAITVNDFNATAVVSFTSAAVLYGVHAIIAALDGREGK